MDKNIKKSISVIIATFNGYKFIKQAIDSVLSQSFKDFEIIVVDDGSTDNRLKEILKKYISENLIHYIYRKNGGPGVARNTGVEASNGKYLAFLDDDDYWDKDKLKDQFSFVENNPRYIAFYTDSCIINPDGELNIKTRKETSGKPYDGKIIRRIIFRNFITLSSSLIRKDIFIKVGMFDYSDPKLYMIEDYDLWLKLATEGEFCYVDKPLVYYRTRLPLNRNQKCIAYNKLVKLFWVHFFSAKLKYKIYYFVGEILYFSKYVYHCIFNIIRK